MKKFVYAILIAVSCSLAFTACTEEEVAPNTENGGGTADGLHIGR
jgi:hypothetical protein